MTQFLINKNLREHFNPMTKRNLNSIPVNTNVSLEHFLKTAEIAYNLVKEGRTIIAEGKLLNGKRPDLVVLDLESPIAYEILQTEKDSNILIKAESYPMRIIKVHCK